MNEPSSPAELCPLCGHSLASDKSCVRCDGFELRGRIEIVKKQMRRKAGQNQAYRLRLHRTEKEWKTLIQQARRRTLIWE